MRSSESRFNGHIREFRWWRRPRSQFHFMNFKNVDLTDLRNFSPPNQLLAYWKLNENRRTETLIRDFASNNTVILDPVSLGRTMADIMDMREIYLRMCPEGTFIRFN